MTEQNPLLDQQLEEVVQVKQFLDSPVWTWLKARLETKRRALMVKATAPGVKRDDRMIYMGKLSQVVEILERPGELLELQERVNKAAEEAAPIEERELPTQRYLPGLV